MRFYRVSATSVGSEFDSFCPTFAKAREAAVHMARYDPRWIWSDIRIDLGDVEPNLPLLVRLLNNQRLSRDEFVPIRTWTLTRRFGTKEVTPGD